MMKQNVEELRKVYESYIKIKSEQYKSSDEIFSDFYTHDEFFNDLLINPLIRDHGVSIGS